MDKWSTKHLPCAGFSGTARTHWARVKLKMRQTQSKLRLGLVSLVAAIAIIVILVITIAPEIDLDDIVIRAGQLFLGLLLALIFSAVCQGGLGPGSPANLSNALLQRFRNLFCPCRVTALLC
jgi:hypothetical protein